MSFRRRRTLLAVAGVLALVIGLAASFPARLALDWFAPPEVRAWGVDGTVWRGRAAEFSLAGMALGSVSWDAHALRLLSLRPTWNLAIRHSDGFAHAGLSVSLSGARIALTGLEAALPLESLPPQLVPDGVAGQVSAAFQSLEFERGWPVRIVGRAAVAQLRLPGVILTLGPFEFSFAEQSGAPVAVVRSLGGPLAVDGLLELPARGEWQFSAELAPGENPPPELVEGLAYIGEDIGGGKRRLTLSGGL